MMIRTHLAGIVAAVVVMAGGSQAAHAEPLRIGYLTWVGLGPLFVAKEKGLFAKEGVEVELQYAIDVWSSLGALDVPLTPADVIRHDLWVE
jgi:NitT/TauT family transport system substrate-binding protein